MTSFSSLSNHTEPWPDDLSDLQVSLTLHLEGVRFPGQLLRLNANAARFRTTLWLGRGDTVQLILLPPDRPPVRFEGVVFSTAYPGIGPELDCIVRLVRPANRALAIVRAWFSELSADTMFACPEDIDIEAPKHEPIPCISIEEITSEARRDGFVDEVEVPLALLDLSTPGPPSIMMGGVVFDDNTPTDPAEYTLDPDTEPSEPVVRPSLSGDRLTLVWNTAHGFLCSWRGGLSQGSLHLNLPSLRVGTQVKLRLELPDGQVLSVRGRVHQRGTVKIRLTLPLRQKLGILAKRCVPA